MGANDASKMLKLTAMCFPVCLSVYPCPADNIGQPGNVGGQLSASIAQNPPR